MDFTPTLLFFIFSIVGCCYSVRSFIIITTLFNVVAILRKKPLYFLYRFLESFAQFVQNMTENVRRMPFTLANVSNVMQTLIVIITSQLTNTHILLNQWEGKRCVLETKKKHIDISGNIYTWNAQAYDSRQM